MNIFHALHTPALWSPWVTLAVAIVTEVLATSSLKASDGLTRLWPSLGAVLGYVVSLYCLSLTQRTMAIGVVYAIWSGVGIVLISLMGWWVFDQVLSPLAVLGMALIVVGVLVLQLWA
ncbi:multidrug efflux SMR transporter [Rhodoferax sp.]|uniref:DMT family transporter n=1 Tax=Rhodoferax sp. TaxID=50421 RepID=UPI0026344BB6|nr:multidrug efflux SMR transporter [Rhodoferax sp.]MDD2810670.1 multidrug efflux SMR transporter [Rhodoferax sp.]MDD4944322.1 multidrug efflux SMR transporter [Rhodoferax sp.]MDD5479606.1 multidrug efflux SMR transporter [Rhodoferax sp.]